MRVSDMLLPNDILANHPLLDLVRLNSVTRERDAPKARRDFEKLYAEMQLDVILSLEHLTSPLDTIFIRDVTFI